ncbi:MAG: DUF1836 domain-containing protein [Lachnospiraceae bacterium]|nr:DUF1836 domain-containing protein [Lachnospiraceae bacterium]
MSYNKELVEKKLLRWEHYIRNFSLPDWDDIPDIGLYMEQVITYLTQKLNYLPPNMNKDESLITPATINNYVRTRIMPEPVKKRYYRIHLAYLLMICTLKQSLSIALLQTLLPSGESEEEVTKKYTAFVERHHIAVEYFGDQIEQMAGPLIDQGLESKISAHSTEDLIFSSVIIAGFSKIFAQKLLGIRDKDLTNGGLVDFSPPVVGKDRK